MAAKLVVEVVGNTDGLERSFKRAGVQATGFGASLGKLSVGFGQLLKGVVIVDILQKAFQGLEGAAKLGIEEFSAQTKVAAQTVAVLKSTGDAAHVSAKGVSSLALSLSDLSGQTKPAIQGAENVLLSFTRIQDFAGKNNQIFSEATKAVVNYAARTGKDASSAALIFGRALEDPASKAAGLSRAGIVLTKSQEGALKAIEKTSGVVAAQRLLISDLTVRYSGAAKAAGETVPGELNKLRNALSEIAGDVVGKNVTGFQSLLAVGVRWAQNASNQARVANDVQHALHDVGAAAHDLKAVFDDAEPKVKAISDALGGTKRSVELLSGAFVAFKAAKLLDGFTAITGGARTAGAEVGTLRGRLLGLEALGPIAVAVDVLFTQNKGGLKGTVSGKGSFGPNVAEDAFTAGAISGKFVGGLATDFVKANLKVLGLNPDGSPKAKIPTPKVFSPAELAKMKALGDQAALQNRGTFGTTFPLINFGKGAGLPPPPGGSGSGLTQTQKNQFFDSAISSDLARAGFLTNVKSQIGALQNVADLIRQRIGKTKDVTRLRTLEDQLLSVTSQISGDQTQVASDFIASLQFGLTKAQATAGFGDDLRALDRIQAALKAQIKATGATLDLKQQLFDVQQQIGATKTSASSAKDFKLLGFGPTGDDLVPGKAHLKKLLASVTDAISGTSLDTSKVKSQLTAIGKELGDALVPTDVRSKMQALLANLEQQLKGFTDKQSTFKRASASSLVAGIQGLTADQKRALEGRLAQIGPNGTVPSRGPAFAGAGAGGFSRGASGPTINFNGDLHLHGVQDVKQLEAQLIKRASLRANVR